MTTNEPSENEPDSSSGRVEKTAARVADNLRQQIIRGELLAGQRLPSEQSLTEQYRISRPILREAYRILESERLIDVRRGAKGGAVVRMPSVSFAASHAGLLLQFGATTLADVFEARAVLEAPAAASVAAVHDEDGLARLRASLTSARVAVDDPRAQREAMLVSSRGFHSLLVELSGNRTLTLLESMLDVIVDQAYRNMAATRSSTSLTPSFEASCHVHEQVYELIVRSEVDSADILWRRHLRDDADRTAAVLPEMVIDVLG